MRGVKAKKLRKRVWQGLAYHWETITLGNGMVITDSKRRLYQRLKDGREK